VEDYGITGALGLVAAFMFFSSIESRTNSGRITFSIVGLLLTAGAIVLYLMDKGKL
jgi:hypothetical protein